MMFVGVCATVKGVVGDKDQRRTDAAERGVPVRGGAVDIIALRENGSMRRDRQRMLLGPQTADTDGSWVGITLPP